MKIIETKFHGYFDYTLALLFLWIPTFFHLKADRTESILFYVLAMLILFFTLLSDSHFGLYKVLPVISHLVINMLLGVFLMLSPWLFGFWNSSFFPHLLFGGIIVAGSLLTAHQSKQAR
ncbi:MAG: hypothetical protein EOO20_19385 [Chryseobacterium sp.]|nr:MAG: hypothetical protein EOO20_19385 [Chryseobacterium sp.]